MPIFFGVTCLVLIAAVCAYELSPNLAEYICVLNGVYNNHDQAVKENLTLLGEHIRYLYVPALSKNPVMYFELTDGDVLMMAHIGILTEDNKGNIRMAPHNFTDISDTRPNTINDSFIRSLTPDKLHEQPGCGTVFVRLQTLVFDGVWPECKHTTANGKHRTYKAAITCDGLIAAIPPGATETTTLEPYSVRHIGKRFRPEGAPDNYTCGCEGTSDWGDSGNNTSG